MAVIKVNNNRWLAHINKKGMPRVRRSFVTRKLAEQFENQYIDQHTVLNTLPNQSVIKAVVVIYVE